MRKVNNKIALLLPLVIVFFANQGCQTITNRSVQMDDVSRTHHARQLLLGDYNKSIVSEFEKDENFTAHIEKFISQENASIDAQELTKSLVQVSRDYFYDPVFLLAIAKTESQFNPFAIGSAGEIGLMQIKPETAEWICLKKNIPWRGAEALKDPAYNVLVGAIYFQYLKKSLNAKSIHYINAYNLGINNLQRLPAVSRIRHPYYDKVMGNYINIYQQLKKIREKI